MRKAPYLFVLLIACITQSVFGQSPPETPYGVPQTPSDIPMPPYLGTVNDNDYGIDYVRLSDMDAFSTAYGSSISYGAITHQYSKIQAWNSDNSLIFLGTIFLLDGHDYSIQKLISDYGNDSRWANTEPNFRYNCRDNHFRKTNVAVSPEVTDTLITIDDYGTLGIGPWEGNLSADDRYVVLTEVVNGAGTKARVYDIKNNVILGSYTGSFDWASMTPSGDYVAIANLTSGDLELYDKSFNFIRILANQTQHGDFAVDSNGDEVFVQVIPLSMIRLSDGVLTDLLPATNATAGTCGYNNYNPNISGHVSGRNFDKPGWAFVSSDRHECSNGNGYDWRNRLFAVKLDGSGTIMHFGYSRSTYATPLITTNRAGTKVLFHTNWDMFGQGDQTAGSYLSFLGEYTNALPVEMVDFSISKFNNQVKVQWITLSEKNNDGFFVQRSADGAAWENLGFISGKGDSNTEISYQFVDTNPFDGRNYYRLAQYDFDGKESTSQIMSLYFESHQLKLFPNPASSIIQLDTKGKELNQVMIYNMLGQTVLSDLSGNTTLDVSHLDNGQYILFAQAEGTLLREKLLIE